MFVVKLRRFISTNAVKRTAEAVSASKRDDYYKNLGGATESNEKPLDWDGAMPYESIPGPKPLPVIGNLWRFLPYIGEYYNVPLVPLYKSLKERYGDILILRGLGRKPMVVLFDVNDIEKNFRNEGSFPLRRGMESFTHYRTVTKKDLFQGATGVLTVQGEEWFKFRSTVNPILMQPRAVQQYVGSMDKVASELVDNIRFFSTQNEKGEMPGDFENELYKWALESIGVVALDKHLGCLNLNAPKDSEPQRLISNVNEMFRIMYKLDVLPPIWKFIETPTWKKYVSILDSITETTMKYTEESLNKTIEEDIPEHKLSVLQRLAKQNKKIAITMVMDMLMAGIDTTGKTLGAALYFLARNPDKQERLREEVFKNLPNKDSTVTKEALNQSPYLKAVIKETTRIAPIAIGNVRTSVKDMVLGGYQIPKGTEIITLNIITANSEEFKDHEKFIPERWLRSTVDEYSHKKAHPFAYLPFGFGPRSCIGKRFANLEVEVALSKVIRNFELSWPHEDMVFSGKFLYGIDGPLKLNVKPL
ncbi:hypothetical protein NQ315_007122 [Exocentrus adspersus]|uniref:Cytochrome P450 n=1 Tax=Exocentrus adspersus TaxID=1586481 RepID=A0AAV8WF18_9CUCU|nr:hypothetical protein NQ315_007122 [Exocentrus adspersus]